MLFLKKQGFTLIELMVVIVIIGVLASLAIPRFTEASAKAKAAEAPRVIASFESAWLALVAEQGTITALDGLIFEWTAVNSESKWWTYTAPTTQGSFTASAAAQMGKIPKDATIGVTYNATDNSFSHTAVTTAVTTFKKYIPNFFRN